MFNEAALDELAESIKANGILQPILVRPDATGKYEIVAGERRYRAALKAGLRQVPIVVRQLTDEETLSLALIENLIREDLGPLEAARAYQRLMNDFGWTQEETGKRVGKSRSAVANTLRLLRLPEVIQRAVERGELSEGHARNLIGDDSERDNPVFTERQMRVFRQITEQGLSVRETERLMKASGKVSSPTAETASVPASNLNGDAEPTISAKTVAPAKAGKEGKVAPTPDVNPDLRAVEDRLRDTLGTRVRIVGNDGRGRIEVEYYSLDELDGLVQRLEHHPAIESITKVKPNAPAYQRFTVDR